jgi:Flp pilus assembly protein TadG
MLALAMVLVVTCAVEVGIVFWTWQALESAATEAARCAAINSSSCKNVSTTPANTQSYALTVVQARGLSGVTTSNITVTTGAGGAGCGTTTAQIVSVAISYQFSPIFLPPLPSTISASACYPLIAG